jgi:hypothetical protein
MFLEANDYKSPFPITENKWVNMQESSLDGYFGDTDPRFGDTDPHVERGLGNNAA